MQNFEVLDVLRYLQYEGIPFHNFGNTPVSQYCLVCGYRKYTDEEVILGKAPYRVNGKLTCGRDECIEFRPCDHYVGKKKKL